MAMLSVAQPPVRDANKDRAYQFCVRVSDQYRRIEWRDIFLEIIDEDEARRLNGPTSVTKDEGETEVTTCKAVVPEGASIIWSDADPGGGKFETIAGALSFDSAPNHSPPSDSDELTYMLSTSADPNGLEHTETAGLAGAGEDGCRRHGQPRQRVYERR